jgi:hypothetical protein
MKNSNGEFHWPSGIDQQAIATKGVVLEMNYSPRVSRWRKAIGLLYS